MLPEDEAIREGKTSLDIDKDRLQLIEEHIYLVKEVARTLIQKLPNHVELDELESLGYIGLLDAVEKYDSSRGVPFEAYSRLRIRGTILDGLRKEDWLSASARRKANRIAEIYDQYDQELQRPATDEEVAEALGITVEEFRKVVLEVQKELVSLEGPLFTDQEGNTQAFIDLIPSEENVSLDLEKKHAKELLTEAIEKLPEKERLVIALVYYEGLNLTEIAEVLELSTSRISQLHSKAILRLRGRLGRKKAELM